MAFFKKGNPLRSITTQKCPACQEGEFFVHPHGYRTSEVGTVLDKCPKCGQRYTIEPGFYFGAAYVSYALNVALMVSCAVAVYVLVPEPKALHYVFAILGFTFLLFPGIFRFSRIIWATMFIPFGGEKRQFNKD